jgi:hypothetical protein
MYSVNDVPLDNPDFGWSMLRRSQPLTPVSRTLSSITVPGRNGVIQGVPSYKDAPTVTLVIRTPGGSLDALYALFEANGGSGYFSVTDDPSRHALFETASLAPEGINYQDELVNLTVTLRFPSADWRDTARTTVGPTDLTDPVTTLDLFDGISSDITDMDIFIDGDFGNLELIDQGSGSWLKTIATLPYVSGSGLLWVGATGQAFKATTASPWTPTSDVSNYVDVSGGGGFRFSSTWDTDPSDRSAKMQVTVTNTSDVAITVRAYNAYSLRNGEV